MLSMKDSHTPGMPHMLVHASREKPYHLVLYLLGGSLKLNTPTTAIGMNKYTSTMNAATVRM